MDVLFIFLYFFFIQQKQQLPDMEFGRRMATERDLEKTDTLRFSNVGNELYYYFCKLTFN